MKRFSSPSSLFVILCGGFLQLTGSFAAEVKHVWEIAQPGRVVAGAPKHSDVTVRSLRLRPVNAGDPHDTFRMAQEFHITRLEWCYGVDKVYVKRAKELGLTIGGAMGANMSDAKGKMDSGRVTDKEGKLRTYKWMADGIWAGCPNAPEYRAAWLFHATNYLASGVDLIQQDDPHMSTRTTSLCYCRYCTAAFAKYQARHGANASYEKFQQDSVLSFHRELHQQLDALAGRHIPFSHNNVIGFSGNLDWTAVAFDFVNAEIEGKHVHPVELAKIAAVGRAAQMPLVFQYRETNVFNNRRALAAIYANGMNMLLPWDVYMPDNAPRYFGRKEEYADLTGFIRANASYLDGYEHVAAAGPGLQDKNLTEVPARLEGGSGATFAFVRAQPGRAEAPVVIHLVEWADQGKAVRLLLRKQNFWGERKLNAKLLMPAEYDEREHSKAQQSKNFSGLTKIINLPVTPSGEWLSLESPALKPWGMVVVQTE